VRPRFVTKSTSRRRTVFEADRAARFVWLQSRLGRGTLPDWRTVSPPLALVKVTPDGNEEPLHGATFGSLQLRAFEATTR
jgi:hypothetical protein